MRCTVLGAGRGGLRSPRSSREGLHRHLVGQGHLDPRGHGEAPPERALSPGVVFPASLHAATDIAKALEGAVFVVVAVPSHAVRQVAYSRRATRPRRHAHRLRREGDRPRDAHDDERGDGRRPPGAVDPYLAVLSGPSFATEVAKGLRPRSPWRRAGSGFQVGAGRLPHEVLPAIHLR